MWKLIKVNSPEWIYLLFGCIGCSVNGGLVPIYAYFYGQVFEVRLICFTKISLILNCIFTQSLTLKGDDLRNEALFWSFMFVILGIVSGLAIVCQVCIYILY